MSNSLVMDESKKDNIMYVWVLEYDSNDVEGDKDWFDIVDTKELAIKEMNSFIKNNDYLDKVVIKDDEFMVVYDTIQYGIIAKRVRVATEQVDNEIISKPQPKANAIVEPVSDNYIYVHYLGIVEEEWCVKNLGQFGEFDMFVREKKFALTVSPIYDVKEVIDYINDSLNV